MSFGSIPNGTPSPPPRPLTLIVEGYLDVDRLSGNQVSLSTTRLVAGSQSRTSDGRALNRSLGVESLQVSSGDSRLQQHDPNSRKSTPPPWPGKLHLRQGRASTNNRKYIFVLSRAITGVSGTRQTDSAIERVYSGGVGFRHPIKVWLGPLSTNPMLAPSSLSPSKVRSILFLTLSRRRWWTRQTAPGSLNQSKASSVFSLTLSHRRWWIHRTAPYSQLISPSLNQSNVCSALSFMLSRRWW